MVRKVILFVLERKQQYKACQDLKKCKEDGCKTLKKTLDTLKEREKKLSLFNEGQNQKMVKMMKKEMGSKLTDKLKGIEFKTPQWTEITFDEDGIPRYKDENATGDADIITLDQLIFNNPNGEEITGGKVRKEFFGADSERCTQDCSNVKSGLKAKPNYDKLYWSESDTTTTSSINPVSNTETKFVTKALTLKMDNDSIENLLADILMAMQEAAKSGEIDSYEEFIKINELEWLYAIPLAEIRVDGKVV